MDPTKTPKASKRNIPLSKQVERLKEQRRCLNIETKEDSSDSDKIIDRTANRARETKRKRRRRRRRKSQNLPKKVTPGILDEQTLETIMQTESTIIDTQVPGDDDSDEEPSGKKPERKRARCQQNTVMNGMDKDRATGFEGDSLIPNVRPLNEAIAQFAKNARESAKKLREEVSESLAREVDSDVQRLMDEPEPGATVLKNEAEPDEYRMLFRECALTNDPDRELLDPSCPVFRLISEEIGRDKQYRNATLKLMASRLGEEKNGDARELKRPNLGKGCDPDYVSDFLREAALPLERPCVRGPALCAGMNKSLTWPDTLQTAKPETAVLLREFWPPDEWERIQETGKLPEVRRHCRLCTLWNTKRAVQMLASKGQSLPAEGIYVVQRHWDIIAEPGTGGYTAQDMLPMHDIKTGRYVGLVAPVQDYRPHRYEDKIHDVWDPETRTMLRVKGFVEKFEDFC